MFVCVVNTYRWSNLCCCVPWRSAQVRWLSMNTAKTCYYFVYRQMWLWRTLCNCRPRRPVYTDQDRAENGNGWKLDKQKYTAKAKFCVACVWFSVFGRVDILSQHRNLQLAENGSHLHSDRPHQKWDNDRQKQKFNRNYFNQMSFNVWVIAIDVCETFWPTQSTVNNASHRWGLSVAWWWRRRRLLELLHFATIMHTTLTYGWNGQLIVLRFITFIP